VADAWLSELKTVPTRPGWARTLEPFRVYSFRVGDVIEVPAGFEFDWDSLPRIMVPVYAWLKDRTNRAACLHDWLYYSGAYPKATSELIFLDFMKLEGVARRHRWSIFAGVFLGGWPAWRKHRRGQGDSFVRAEGVTERG
jgi:hypothetical protein